MKNHLILLFTLMTFNGLLYGLNPNECQTAKSHLIEINPEWKIHLANYTQDLHYPINFQSDNDRIQFHLQNVVAFLSQAERTPHSEDAKIQRKVLLTELLKYASENRFPRNKYHQNRQPYFVDEDNRDCAVAHLLRFDKELNLIAEIESEKNNHYIKEMKIKALLDWAGKVGFTEDELALIQPSYPSSSLVWTTWGNGSGIDGRVNVMKSILSDQLLVLGGDFSSIDGVAANNFIGWNGDDWVQFGEGSDIVGTINDIASLEDGSLFIGGSFELNGVRSNIAQWDSNLERWTSMVQEMNGEIHCLEIFNDRLYIGGSFTELNDLELSNLAHYDFMDQTWGNSNNENIEGAFSTDYAVNDFEIYSDTLIVAGDFTKTGILSTDNSINQDSCTYLSFWDGNNWEHKLQGDLAPVRFIDSSNELICAGNHLDPGSYAVYRDFDLDWEYYISEDNFSWFEFDEESEFNGLHNGILYGKFGWWGFTSSINYFAFGTKGINQINGSIHAMADFQGQTYMAGTFTELENQAFNGLAITDGSLPSTEIPNLDIRVYSSFNTLYLEGKIVDAGSLNIYNELGQLMYQQRFDDNNWPSTIELDHLNDGIYFYQLQTGANKVADRIVHVGG